MALQQIDTLLGSEDVLALSWQEVDFEFKPDDQGSCTLLLLGCLIMLQRQILQGAHEEHLMLMSGIHEEGAAQTPSINFHSC